MTIKNIETAYEEIYDFLDEIDSHPLSAQISLPIPDLVDGVWVDKYFVYEDVSIGGKHIAYSPERIFVFKDGKLMKHQPLEDDDRIVEYKILYSSDSIENNLMQYIESYSKIKSLNLMNGRDQSKVIDQYLNNLKKIIPQEIVSYYKEVSIQLCQWLV